MQNQLKRTHRTRLFQASLLALVPLAGCSSGTGPSSFQEVDDFALLSTNLQPNAVWELNRPIELRFNAEVDLSTVTSNTISVITDVGTNASGLFSYGLAGDGSVDREVVVFQPSCPTEADLSDSGLQPETDYLLRIQGGIGNQTTVQDITGRPLEIGGAVEFVSASGTSLGDLFVDTLPGAPNVRVRGGFGVDLDDLAATYLEIGGDPENRIYFQLDQDLRGSLPAGVEAPLNLYSLEETSVAAVVFFDQPLAPGATNVNAQSIALEWRVTQDEDDWQALISSVSLEANCTATGAAVRIEPQGVLPAGAELRILVRGGLADLTGELTLNPSDRAGRFPTQSAASAGQDADEILERFLFSADASESNEDNESINGLPRANWGDGLLEASFDFDGTGGIGGNFDLVLIPGQELFVNTSFAQVVGGPDGTPAFTQDIIDGVLDVNDLRIGAGASLTFLGPNPVTILASGEVEISGEISVRGSNNNGVGALNTPNMPEVGSAGNAGGGTGGTGSMFVTQSTPRGGTGFGAYNEPGKGGQGGETGYAPNPTDEDARRAAGGGGGLLGRDVFYDHDDNPGTPDVHCQTLIGMDAEDGCGGAVTALGAISQSERPMGGLMGPFPFIDDSDDNDFLGSMVMANGQFVLGETDIILGGAGGGGGGDAVASDTFPLTPFTNTGDEKGSGGGGAAGGLRILAIGPIIVREGGSVVADGGYGGGGENTFDAARIAGGGGGGSGGHIVLSSAAFVEIQAEATEAGDGYRDDPTALDHFPRPLSALGGQGGEGRRAQFSGAGGASGSGPTRWRRDGIRPISRIDGNPGGDVPPLDTGYENFMPDYDDVLGPALAAAGDGSPGIIQIHLEDPALDLRFTHPNVGGVYGVPGGADVTRSSAPPPFGWNGLDAQSDNLLPFFGRFSASQSEWIHLGLPSIDNQGNRLPVEFLFAGIDPVTGEVNTSNNQVLDLPPVLGPDTVGQGAGEARILPGGTSIEFDSTGLPGFYKTSTQLLLGFDIRLEVVGQNEFINYEVQAATEDLPNERLTLFVGETATTPEEFVQSAGGAAVEASIIPRFVRVETDGQQGVLPPGASIAVSFDATVSNSLSLPDETASFSAGNGGEFTSDIDALSMDPWSWVRFRVIFDLSGGGELPLDTPRPGMRLIRVPFQFQ